MKTVSALHTMNPEQTANLKNSLKNLSVRLSVDGQPIGSGFVVISTDKRYAYILTARHCFDNLQNIEAATVEWYDYETSTFIPINIALDQCPLLAFPKVESESSYDGAVLVIPYAKLPVPVIPTVTLGSINSDQICRFIGFPNALENKEPEEFKGEVGLEFGDTFRVKAMDAVEDNSSMAYANVKGFSGSGLFFQEGGQVYLMGIITDFQSFKRFVTHKLNNVNQLLRERELPEMLLEKAPALKSNISPVDSVDFVDQCRRLLDEAEQAWLDLRPKYGLRIVRTMCKNLEEAILSPERRRTLLARVSYLEALTAGDLKEELDIDKLFIEAYGLAPNILTYQERATIAFLNKNQLEKAYELAELILKTQPFNPFAWQVIAHLEPNETVPETVLSDSAFKVAYLTRLSKKSEDNTIYMSDCLGLFPEEIEKHNLPDSISRRNIYYWSFLALITLHKLIARLVQAHNLERPKELLGNDQLKHTATILSIICQRVENSDFRNDKFFQVLRFEYCYCQYLLTEDANIAHQMSNQLFELFIGTKNLLALPYISNSPGAIEAIPHRLIDLLQILFSQNEGQKMLDVLAAAADTSYSSDPILDLFKGMAYGILKKKEEQVEFLRNYLTNKDNLNELDTNNFLDPIRILLSSNVSIETIQEIVLDNKNFENPLYKTLLEAFIWCKRDKLRAHACASEVKEHWNVLPDILKHKIARIYLELEDWTIAKQLHYQLCDINIESEELYYYLIALHHEGQEITSFLQLAAQWREKFSPKPTLIELEQDMYRRLHNWPKMEEVAIYALSHYPDSIGGWWDLVRALHAQGEVKKEDLLEKLALDDRVFYKGYSISIRFALAHICFTAGLLEKGLEIYYQALKDYPDNPTVEHNYFSLSTKYKAFDNLVAPDTATQDTIVKLRVGSREDLLELTEEKIKHHRVAKAVIGLRVGESFKLSGTAIDVDEEHIVIQIMDKYSGQFALIAKKAEKPLSGLPLKSFKIETDETGEFNIELFNKQLQSLFGAEGTKRKLIRDNLRQQFTSGQIGFAELCQGVFSGDPLAAWNYATSDEAGGFPIQPKFMQTPISINEETEYILDFTSVLTLFSLSKLKPLLFKEKKFIVSQLLIDYIMEELQSSRQERGSKMSQDILIDRTTVYFHPEDLQERKTAFYQDLLDWVISYCKADYAPERLSHNFTRNDPDEELFIEDSLYTSSITDSLLLAYQPNRVFVTDDFLAFRLPDKWVRAITVEHFLHIEYNELMMQQLWLELIGFNFRGLTLEADQLFQVFKSSLLDDTQKSKYFKAKFSFSYEYNKDPRLLQPIILFLKKVYTENLSLDYKRQVSQALLRRFFTGMPPITERGIILIRLLIDREFRLISQLGEFLMEDFDIVLNLEL